jgi:hypothetical protein
MARDWGGGGGRGRWRSRSWTCRGSSRKAVSSRRLTHIPPRPQCPNLSRDTGTDKLTAPFARILLNILHILNIPNVPNVPGGLVFFAPCGSIPWCCIICSRQSYSSRPFQPSRNSGPDFPDSIAFLRCPTTSHIHLIFAFPSFAKVSFGFSFRSRTAFETLLFPSLNQISLTLCNNIGIVR